MVTPRAADGFSPQILERALRPLLGPEPGAAVVIAVSGGADSAALLAATAALPVGTQGLRLRALHIDHGLAGARPLAAAARTAASQLGVPFEVVAVTVAPATGDSLEAVARDVRHAAFAAALRPGECLLTAHHREDQAETLLLQLLRGSGLPGLAAMPAAAPLGLGRLLRPLLEVSREALRAYLASTGLAWHEDPMNADPRFDRAYLRSVVWPTLAARWPAAATTLSRSARHVASAQRLHDDRSCVRLAALGRGAALPVAKLLTLAPGERDELVRYWIRAQGLPVPPARRLALLEAEVLRARPSALPRLAWAGGELCRYGGLLHAFAPLPPLPVAPRTRLAAVPGELSLGALGRLVLRRAEGAGLAVPSDGWQLGPRAGGERLRLVTGGPSRPLKDWLREAGVPPWTRARALLVSEGETLVAVALPHATWVAVERRAAPGAGGLALEWQGAPAALFPSTFIEP